MRSAGDRLTANMDQESLRQTATMLETLTNALRSKLTPLAPKPPSTPANACTALPDAEVPSLTNSQSTSVESDNPVQDEPEPKSRTTEVDIKKNLPSPAATDDVNGGTQLDEQSKELDAPTIIAPEVKTDEAAARLADVPVKEEVPSTETSAILTQDTNGADAMDLD